VRRYHICLTPISLSAFDPRLYSSEGQTAYYFRLFRLNKNQLNISQYVKEPFVYVGWNFLSFLSTSIYNQPRTELNTPPKLFWNFFAFYSFSIIYTVHQKRSSVCANDLLCRGYISNVIRLILPPLFCIITAKAFITEYNGGILGGWTAPWSLQCHRM
jgi:hypothetical protein